MYKCIYEPGCLHCFLNGLITFHLREEVTGKGESFDWADWCWIYLMLWYVDNKVLLTAGLSLQRSRRGGWNTDDELMYSYGVTPLLVNSSASNSCYFLQVCSISIGPWLLKAGSKSWDTRNNQRAALPPSPVFLFPPPLSLWCELVVLEQIFLHFNYAGSFCPGFKKLS